MEKISLPRNWATNSGHGILFEEKGKYVFLVYKGMQSPYSTPLASGKRDDIAGAMDAARNAAKKHGISVATWQNLTSLP